MTIQPKTNTSNMMRLLMLLTLAFAGLVVVSVLILSGVSDTFCTLLLQDVLVFIVPAVLTAVICYRQPWQLLCADRRPRWVFVALVVAVWAVSMPVMNWLVEWNQSLHLPSRFAHIEQQLRAMEEQAQAMTEQMLALDGLGELALALIVIAVMAGVSEEFFFRGAMMGILCQGRTNGHAAVWVVAIVFSAFHLQFYGFVPRMLLGAWMGYLLLWSRSLWVPIIAHTLNNGTVVLAAYLTRRGLLDSGQLDAIGVPDAGEPAWLALASGVATLCVVCGFYYFFFKKKSRIDANC